MDLPELALRELEKAGEAGGRLAAEALVLEALVLEAVGRPEQARVRLEAAAKVLGPANGPLRPSIIRAFLGQAASAQGRVSEAVDLYREALEGDPGLGLARRGLAEALGLQGRTEEAIAQYREYLTGNPEDAEALTAVGQLYLSGGRTGEAKTALEQALRLDPGVPGAAEALRRAEEAERKAPVSGR
jgi:tetratricopeptide (TPR) repeat protein